MAEAPDRAGREAELRRLEDSIARTREDLTGVLSERELAETLGPQERKAEQLRAELAGSGALAQGAGATAVGAGAALVQGPVGGSLFMAPVTMNVTTQKGDEGENLDSARRRYLERLKGSCQVLPLAALGGVEGEEADLSLDKVYVELNTKPTALSAWPSPPSQGPETQEEVVQFPSGIVPQQNRPQVDESVFFNLCRWHGRIQKTRVIDELAKSPRTVLLGEAGSGKSTLAKKVLSWQAAAMLSGAAGPPGVESDLLPVLITLRDLAARLGAQKLGDLDQGKRRAALVQAIQDQLVTDLALVRAGNFKEGIEQAIESGRCLLVLDGLDEVPEVVRPLVREATAALITQYQVARIILTCRVRSYVGVYQFPGFDSYILEPLDDEQIRTFVNAWYNAQRDMNRLDARKAEARAKDLISAVQTPHLKELAANPMMLTTMAMIHQREVRLPDRRVELYNLVVDVLALRWQKSKTGEQSLVQSPALTAFLLDNSRLRPTLARLAYEAHRVTREKEGADLDRGQALTLLESKDHLGDAGLAAGFLDYIDQRAGVLVGRGGAPGQPVGYSFPHRTIQEYLAGCHLMSLRQGGRALIPLACEGDYWTLAIELGAQDLLHIRLRRNDILDLAYQLYPAKCRSRAAERQILWSGKLAALAGRYAVESDRSRKGGKPFLKRLTTQLVKLLNGSLSLDEMRGVGWALGHLGDPRFRGKEWWHLPADDHFGFVLIPAGDVTIPRFQSSADKSSLESLMSRVESWSSCKSRSAAVTASDDQTARDRREHHHSKRLGVTQLPAESRDERGRREPRRG